MAKKTNRAEEVQKRIHEMIETKQRELNLIKEKQEEAKEKLKIASDEIRSAAERMDLEEYEKAKAARSKARTALDMYEERYRQIERQEYI